MNLDPITTEVLFARLREIAQRMAHALFHGGYSPILRESQDGTAGLTDAEGNVVIVGGGLQYHCLLYTRAVASVLERYPRDALRPGDSFIANDPYKAGNAHVPDMVAVTPVFHRDCIVGFAVSVAHKADLGGLVPGSSGGGAREVFHEGLLVPPVRYWTAEGVNAEIEAIVRNNSRTPEIVVGDLRGQVGATRLGAELLDSLCHEYGAKTVAAAVRALMETAGERLGRMLRSWPDGTAEVEARLDHDCVRRDSPVHLRLHVEKSGDRLVLDFGGSDPQAAGPINVPVHTARAVSLLAVVAASDPTLPLNSGLLGHLAFRTERGSLVEPQFPAPVNHYFPSAHLVYSCVLSALATFSPDRAVAPAGLGTGAIAIGYKRPLDGRSGVQYELKPTALGATREADGTSVVLPMCHFTPSTPIEVLETEYPIRVRRFDIWCDSAGAGEHRGGVGYVRTYELLEDATVTVKSSNHHHGGWGAAGGGAPPTAQVMVDTGIGDPESLEFLETRELPAGAVVEMRQPGGGGYGDVRNRAPELVTRDVRDGYVSREAARRLYGFEE